MIYSQIRTELKTFLGETGQNGPYSITDKPGAYTASGDYLIYTLTYHTGTDMIEVMERLKELKVDSVIDVGCCSGCSGLLLLEERYYDKMTFHDFEGLGLSFLRWLVDKHQIKNVMITPYDEGQPEKHDLAIAFDVIEHTGNHLGFLKWISSLGKQVAISYPMMKFVPPYVNVMDEWIDDEIIRMAVEKRYKVIWDYKRTGRRFLSWETE